MLRWLPFMKDKHWWHNVPMLEARKEDDDDATWWVLGAAFLFFFGMLIWRWLKRLEEQDLAEQARPAYYDLIRPPAPASVPTLPVEDAAPVGRGRVESRAMSSRVPQVGDLPALDALKSSEDEQTSDAPSAGSGGAAAAAGNMPPADDLAVLEGIGPRIKELLHAAGIRTFRQLAEAEQSRLRQILDDAGIRIANPGTWNDQASLAAAGDWDGLNRLVGELKGGRRTNSS